MSTKNYIAILIESLKKKIIILNELIKKSEEQGYLLDQPDFDTDGFDAVMDEKSKLIVDLRFLDSGFEAVYDSARETLMNDRAAHVGEIRDMQTLIGEITSLGASLEAIERRNDTKFKNRFRNEHQKVRQSRNSMQVANGYYKSMTGGTVQDAQFMDHKF